MRYGFLLVLLIVSYLLSAFLNSNNGKWINDALVVLFTVAVALAIRNLPLRRRTVQLTLSAGAAASLLVIILGVHEGGSVGRGAAAIWTGALLLVTVVLIIRQILSMPSVTAQSIYGAISAYLIIGLMFAQFYVAMWWLNGSFFTQAGNPHSLPIFQYFSFTTLTTLGYGDFTAADSAGRAVAMIEAMSGQIFLATLVAKLVAAFRPGAVTAGNAPGGAGTDHPVG